MALTEKAGIRMEWSTEKPESFQLMRLVDSDIRWISPRRMWTNLPLSSKPPSNMRQWKCGFHRKKSPLVWYARTIPARTGLLAVFLEPLVDGKDHPAYLRT